MRHAARLGIPCDRATASRLLKRYDIGARAALSTMARSAAVEKQALERARQGRRDYVVAKGCYLPEEHCVHCGSKLCRKTEPSRSPCITAWKAERQPIDPSRAQVMELLRADLDRRWPHSRPRSLRLVARELETALDAAKSVTEPTLRAECVERIENMVLMVEGLDHEHDHDSMAVAA